MNKNNKDIRIGERNLMRCGLYAEIIDYVNAMNITIKFDDGTVKEHKQYGAFKNGSLSNKTRGTRAIDFRGIRLSEERLMNCGLKARIIAYRNAKDIDIEFENGIVRKNIQYSRFLTGSVPL